MSRVGKNPVTVPAGVEVSIADGQFHAKGKNGEQVVPLSDLVDVSIADGRVAVAPKGTSKRIRQAWGTMRMLVNNAVIGVSEGFVKRMEVNGVGYRAQVQGSTLKLALGFSHDVLFPIPDDVKIAIEGDKGQLVIAVYGASKQRVGQVASEIRTWRTPEPYKGKGIKYAGEIILRKEGKKK